MALKHLQRMTLVLVISLFISACNEEPATVIPEALSFNIALKKAGNPAESYPLQPVTNGSGFSLKAEQELPVSITGKVSEQDSVYRLTITLKANRPVSFHFSGQLATGGISYDDAYFLLPGFWYRKNLRSPENAPSARISKNWTVREDRLSIPLTAVYNTNNGTAITVTRIDGINNDVLMPYDKGDIILHGNTDMGTVGFGEKAGSAYLSFGFPFSESPVSYVRKLTLDPPVRAFLQMEAGEERTLTWQVNQWTATSYSEFVKNVWDNSFDFFNPEAIEPERTEEEIKEVLTNYYTQSYTDAFEVKGFSGVHLHIDQCEKRGIIETGFVGRVLLNAFNALEYGYEYEDEEMLRMAHEIYQSYTESGFTGKGFIREVIDFREGHETSVYSIRRQAEGLYAILQFLYMEKQQHRMHTELEEKTRTLLDNILTLQEGNAFPRKFTNDMVVTDAAKGSTSTAVIPLLMGYYYFGEPRYLEAARSAATYLEEEIISKGDYFSSTLDANCEDKEASIYAACAMFYLGVTSDNESQQQVYFDLAEQASYFALSWYYLWDVPFAPGQMLGDLGFRTRGWGNVSVENNHVDVYIFDFADVLRHLAELNGNERLGEMAALIKSSMQEQLLPVEGRMCGIAKTGYYPEVVQHTNWDYGQFGKGYYNDLFAPGWTVASLWELLSEDRLYNFFQNNRSER